VKVGDLVKWKSAKAPVGLVKRVFDHKLWNTDEMGKKINWNKVATESFAEVLFGDNLLRLPIRDLEIINER
jgi:hypothetical protein